MPWLILARSFACHLPLICRLSLSVVRFACILSVQIPYVRFSETDDGCYSCNGRVLSFLTNSPSRCCPLLNSLVYNCQLSTNRCPMSCPFFFLNHQTEVFRFFPPVLSPRFRSASALVSSVRCPCLFSPTLRGGSQGRQGAGRSPKVLLWHACANLCQNT